MRLAAFVFAAALGLAACDRGPEVDLTNVTPAEVAKAMKDSGTTRSMVRPGKWSSTVAVLEMNSPGMPPEMQKMMKERIGQPRTVEACLTAEQVDNPERMLGNVPDTCKYDRYTMGKGKLNGTMRCEQNGAVQQMTVAGKFDDDSYSLTIDNKTSVPAGVVAGQPAQAMSMKMKVDSRRLGECDGTELKPGLPATSAPQSNAQPKTILMTPEQEARYRNMSPEGRAHVDTEMKKYDDFCAKSAEC